MGVATARAMVAVAAIRVMVAVVATAEATVMGSAPLGIAGATARAMVIMSIKIMLLLPNCFYLQRSCQVYGSFFSCSCPSVSVHVIIYLIFIHCFR